MMNIKKPLITRIVSLIIAIVFLFTETGYSADRPLTLRPALQFSNMGKEVIKGGKENPDTAKNKEHLIFHARIMIHEIMNMISVIVGFFDLEIEKPAERTKSDLFSDKAVAMQVGKRVEVLLKRLEQTPDSGYEDSAREIIALFTSILKEFEEIEFPDLTLEDAELREQLNANRQSYELAKRIIRNFIKTNGSFDLVGTSSITNAVDSLSGPVMYFRSRLSIVLSMSQDLLPVAMDPDLLIGVWMNLLRNASEAGATQIVINGHNKDGMIIIGMKDNGLGIDPKDIGHIFQPFWTKGKSKGTGLGLYICQEVIRRAGGTIEVQSELGKGTTFTIRLPVAQDTQLELIRDSGIKASRSCL